MGRQRRFVVLSLAALALGASGCGSEECADGARCDASPGPGDGGPNTGQTDGTLPPGCDLMKSLKDAPACVDDAVGVFVSPAGDDRTDGRKSTPVRTIQRGLELAASRRLPRVYVCEGTYLDAVDITSSVAIMSELSCAWDVGGGKATVAPPAGIALRVRDVGGPVVIEGLAIVGYADPTKPGNSAIAAFVARATNVTFRNTDLTATDGVTGAPGMGGSNYSSAAKDGVGAASGATAVTCACVDGQTSSTGGTGDFSAVAEIPEPRIPVSVA